MKEIRASLEKHLTEALEEKADKEIKKIVSEFETNLRSITADLIIKSVQGLKMHIQQINQNTINPEIHIKIEM